MIFTVYSTAAWLSNSKIWFQGNILSFQSCVLPYYLVSFYGEMISCVKYIFLNIFWGTSSMSSSRFYPLSLVYKLTSGTLHISLQLILFFNFAKKTRKTVGVRAEHRGKRSFIEITRHEIICQKYALLVHPLDETSPILEVQIVPFFFFTPLRLFDSRS